VTESARKIGTPDGALTGGSRRAGVVLADFATEALAAFLEEAGARGGAVALLPIGSTEPHGPHLPLSTDIVLSEEACRRAARALADRGLPALVAPPVAYGVTRYAAGFRGAVGVSEATLAGLLTDVARALLDDGFVHVALVNNHLEPEHVAVIERAAATIATERGARCISFPNQLTRRWGRTLTDEFKRGDCHAGRYETSLVLAARPDLVDTGVARGLESLPISLSQAIAAASGAEVRFSEIGMNRAYTGAPAEATSAEGEATYERLVEMIATEVTEHLRADVDGATKSAPLPEKEEKQR
jgi:creatinine amidohydrolase